MSPQAQIFLDVRQDGPTTETSHPAFVAVAPEWFFNEGDPRTPFGSDDGNDTLRYLEEWYATGGEDEHAPGRVAALLGDWDLVPEEVWDRDSVGVTAWLDQDESHVRFLHGEIAARLAGAFGQFKIIGWIHPALRSWAEEALAIAGLLEVWESNAFGVEPDEITRQYRATMATILAAAPEPGALSRASIGGSASGAGCRFDSHTSPRPRCHGAPISGAMSCGSSNTRSKEPTRKFRVGLSHARVIRTRWRRR